MISSNLQMIKSIFHWKVCQSSGLNQLIRFQVFCSFYCQWWRKILLQHESCILVLSSGSKHQYCKDVPAHCQYPMNTHSLIQAYRRHLLAILDSICPFPLLPTSNWLPNATRLILTALASFQAFLASVLILQTLKWPLCLLLSCCPVP